jgi:hypothetical protein
MIVMTRMEPQYALKNQMIGIKIDEIAIREQKSLYMYQKRVVKVLLLISLIKEIVLIHIRLK